MKKQLLALVTGVAIGASGAAVTIGGEETTAKQIAPSDLYATISIDDLQNLKFAKTDEGVRARADLDIGPSIDGFQSWREKIKISADEKFTAGFDDIGQDLKVVLCANDGCEDFNPKMVTLRASLTDDGYSVTGKFADGDWQARTIALNSKEMDVKIRQMASLIIDDWCKGSGSRLCE